MSYMVYGYGYDVPTEDALNIKTRKQADRIMKKRVKDWCKEHDVDYDVVDYIEGFKADDGNYIEGDIHFEHTIDEEGVAFFHIYEVPEFKNEVEELLWKAKLEMDKAYFASEDYKASLCDCCVDDHSEEAKRLIDRAMELMDGWHYKEV